MPHLPLPFDLRTSGMTGEQVLGLIAFIGLLVQLIGSMLLVVFFFLLRRNSSRRTYFSLWAWGWFCLMLAIASLAIRYEVMPNFDGRLSRDDTLLVQALYFAYQFTKLLAYGCIAGGTAVYAAGAKVRERIVPWMLIAALYAATSVAAAGRLDPLVVWQAPVAISAFAYCTVVLLRLAPSRRTLGSEVTGTVFALAVALWAMYAIGFGIVTLAGAGALHGPLLLLLRYDAYLDMVLELLLGFGMVVMLLEDAKRDVDDAHAELAVAHDALRREALLDPLTGAFNRLAFAEGLGLDAAKASFGSVALLDVDNLKTVNDTLGHAAGDALLGALVDALRGAIRPSDRIYRWGGDEFLVVLQGAKADEAQAKLDTVIAGAPPVPVRGEPAGLRLLVSVGAANYAGGEQLVAAIEDADTAMYRAKRLRKGAAALPKQPAA